MLTVLRWNLNGLKPQLPELKTWPHLYSINIQALQGTSVHMDEDRLAVYVGYRSKTIRPGGRCRTYLGIRKGIYHSTVKIDMFTSEAAEYVTVTPRVHRVGVTVVSIFVGPETTWDPRELIQRRRNCPEIVWFAEILMHTTNHGATLVQVLLEGLSST